MFEFRGKKIYTHSWVYGSLIQEGNYCCILQHEDDIHLIDFPYLDNELGTFDGRATPVISKTIGRYTEMTEFVMTNRNVNDKLFEWDIVEVWGWRHPKYDNPRSQYDGDFKVRATIHFQNGAWMLDYDNEYNHNLEKLHGKEVDDRLVNGKYKLYDYGYHGNNEDWQREHNSHYKWDDIVKIGNIWDNPELLEATKND